jgi:NO-binding membrane sensor protein with MHYT domain
MFMHFTFLACVVFGGFLAWKWPRLIWAHVLLVAWGFSTIAFSIRCPLTDVEDWARTRAGEAKLTGTAAVVAAGSWVGFVMRRRSQHCPACPPPH